MEKRTDGDLRAVDELQLEELEKELRALTPASPGNRLRSQLAETLADGRRDRRNARKVLGFPMLSVLAAALAVTALVVVQWQQVMHEAAHPPVNAVVADAVDPSAEGIVPGPKYTLRKAKKKLEAITMDGVVVDGEGNPARLYRYQFVDSMTWFNPADGSIVELSVPREEVVYVPVTTL